MADERTLEEELRREIEAKRFVRAAALAKASSLPLSEVKGLQEKALWQMASVYRNAEGTRVLCEEFGISRKEAEDVLRRWAEEQEKGDTKTLEPTYDHVTGKYLAFKEWLNQFLKDWDKLSPS